MMFKQMLVHKLFVVRSDASRFTATIYYSLYGGDVVIIGTYVSPYLLQHDFYIENWLLCGFPYDALMLRSYDSKEEKV